MSLASHFMTAGRRKKLRPDGPLCVNIYLHLELFTGFVTKYEVCI
jgi:hypothetical protein